MTFSNSNANIYQKEIISKLFRVIFTLSYKKGLINTSKRAVKLITLNEVWTLD